MFLDNTACNLAALNLMKFVDAETRTFDVASFRHAVRLWTIVLEISVLMAQYPRQEIARLSYEYRTLGLGYANIGTLLMVSGIPYDSDEARAITGAITAHDDRHSYATSAEMAKELGPSGLSPRTGSTCSGSSATTGAPPTKLRADEYEGLTVIADGDHRRNRPGCIARTPRARAGIKPLRWASKYGYRNAQTTLIAPTGTIGLLMDCDTTGVEPDFALVKFKKLAGGGYFKIANQCIEPALQNLGYSAEQIARIFSAT